MMVGLRDDIVRRVNAVTRHWAATRLALGCRDWAAADASLRAVVCGMQDRHDWPCGNRHCSFCTAVSYLKTAILDGLNADASPDTSDAVATVATAYAGRVHIAMREKGWL